MNSAKKTNVSECIDLNRLFNLKINPFFLYLFFLKFSLNFHQHFRPPLSLARETLVLFPANISVEKTRHQKRFVQRQNPNDPNGHWAFHGASHWVESDRNLSLWSFDAVMGAAGSKLEKALGDQFPEGERYFGLENFGNTCYCNSVLQV